MFRSDLDKPSRPELHAEAEAAFGALVAVVIDLLEAGHYQGVDPQNLAVYFWSMAHGLATLWVDGSMPGMFEGVALDDLVDNVLSIASKNA